MMIETATGGGFCRDGRVAEMPDPLMTSAALRPYRNALRQRLDELDLPAELRSGAIGDAYAYFLLFENWPDLIEGKPLGAEFLFYNRYYWFVRFTALWQAAHGRDAGAEQQAFQLLERKRGCVALRDLA